MPDTTPNSLVFIDHLHHVQSLRYASNSAPLELIALRNCIPPLLFGLDRNKFRQHVISFWLEGREVELGFIGIFFDLFAGVDCAMVTRGLGSEPDGLSPGGELFKGDGLYLSGESFYRTFGFPEHWYNRL